MKQNRGFTLIELMVVVAIMAVLAALAYSSYNNQIRKSRRADAKQVASDYSLRQEKYRSSHQNFGTLADISGSANPNGSYYQFAVTFPTGTCPSGVAKGNQNGYIITATAQGDQAKDQGCAALVLTNDCGTMSKSPSACW